MTARTSWGKWALPYVELVCAVAAASLWYTQGGAVWYAGDWPGPWPLLLLVLPWLLRPFVFGFSLRLKVFDVALVLFLASAGVGVWAAYDPGPAWAKFWLIVGAVGVYYAVSHQFDLEHLYVVLAYFAVFGVGVSLYFFATNDWDAHLVKVPVLVTVGKQISAVLPSLPGHRMHPNVVGGMLAVVMPMYAALVALSQKDRVLKISPALQRGLVVFWSAAAGVTGVGWLFSMSRGAWLALVSAVGVWIIWRGIDWWMSRLDAGMERAWRVRLWVMTGVLLAGCVLLLGVMSQVLAGRLPGTQTLVGRLNLLRRSLLLARDYAFTGLGLGMFPMHYSIYTLLIHVYHTVYSHNALVDLMIEQGVIGLGSYLLLAISCFVFGLRRLQEATQAQAWVIEAGLCSVGVSMAHGLVDDVLYGSRGVLLLFVPVGLVVAVLGMARESQVVSQENTWRRWAWAAAVGVLLIAGLVWWRPVTGAWYANLGALAQARVELNAYDEQHFDNPTLDQVRRQENLDVAIALLKRAVQVDPANPTARQRLAAIGLSWGQYDAALIHMQAAWEAGYRDEVTRLLWGDALVAAGRTEEATGVVRGLEWAESRLMLQAAYRYRASEDYRRAADAWGTVVLLDPGNSEAARRRDEAEALIK